MTLMKLLFTSFFVFIPVAALISSNTVYEGQIGSKKVNILSDNCWTNTSYTGALNGYKALIVTTSYGEPLDTGDQTGLCLEEATAPYYQFIDAGMEVDITSMQGGVVPYSTSDPQTPSVIEFLADPEAMAKLNNSGDILFSSYDIVFMAGGWGAAFDLGFSVPLALQVEYALNNNYPLVGSTCHGVLGFYLANHTDGITPWVSNKMMTGVTNDQIEQLGISNQTPLHPQDALTEKGAIYQCIHGTNVLGDVGATSSSYDNSSETNDVNDDGDGPIIITGQNQNSACVSAQRQILSLLEILSN